MSEQTYQAHVTVMRGDRPLVHTDPPCEACRVLGAGPYRYAQAAESPRDTVWKAVKAALKEYGREYPHTLAGKAINWIWGK